MEFNTVNYVNRETSSFTTEPVYVHEPTKTVALFSDKKTLKISDVDSFREKLFTGGLSETTSKLFQVCNDQTHDHITVRPGHIWLAGLMKEKLIHFDVI